MRVNDFPERRADGLGRPLILSSVVASGLLWASTVCAEQVLRWGAGPVGGAPYSTLTRRIPITASVTRRRWSRLWPRPWGANRKLAHLPLGLCSGHRRKWP